MTIINDKKSILTGYESLRDGAVSLVTGGTAGYVYAALAHIPMEQAAKAWAIWALATTALMTFVSSFVKDLNTKKFYTALAATVTLTVGIFELQRRGLIGSKMIIFLVACVGYSLYVSSRKNDDEIIILRKGQTQRV